MRFKLGQIVACAGLAFVGSLARAQDSTRIDVEVSFDEFNWQSQLAFVPGDTIFVRVRVSKVGTSTVLGFSNMTFQPTISPWPAGSTVLPFTNAQTGAGVPDLPGLRGRILPFAATPMGPGSAAGLLTWFVDGGPQRLRFAGSNATLMTTNLIWGVACGQLPQAANTSFNTATSVVLFKTAVQISPAGAGEEYTFDVPLAGILASRASWFRMPSGAGSLTTPITSADIHPARAYIGGNPCIAPPGFAMQPQTASRNAGQAVGFDATVVYGICGPFGARWYKGSTLLSDGGRISGASTEHLRLTALESGDAGDYRLLATNATGSTWSNWATLSVACIADTDDGSGSGVPDGGVTIDDLLYYLVTFEQGALRADVDDGSGTGSPDGGVTIDDLLFYLVRFEFGC